MVLHEEGSRMSCSEQMPKQAPRKESIHRLGSIILPPTSSDSSIVQRVVDKKQFHDNRELAVHHPDSALDKLNSYATLTLDIQRGRRLHGIDWHGYSDPYVEIYVSDIFKGKTEHVARSVNPEWNWKREIKIRRPSAVLLLRVMDASTITDHDLGLTGDELLGFVEIPLGELPIGSTVNGWFILRNKLLMCGTALERFAALSDCQEGLKEDCGSVYLEMTLSIVSGQSSDEVYAWSLPTPTFKRYPKGGKIREDMDMQAFVDSIMDLKSDIQGGIIRPVLGFIAYLIGWNEWPLSLFVLSTTLAISLRPDLYASGVVGFSGLLLLLLASPSRREAIASHPYSVPLNDTGYMLVAAKEDSISMAAFITRVVQSLNGLVIDMERLREFAAFAFHEGGLPACEYADLKQQLVEVADDEDPFIVMRGTPWRENTLVKRGESNGQIVQCLETDAHEQYTWKYAVKFDDKKFEEEVFSDELTTRLDLRWLKNPAVLTLIPDTLEDTVTRYAETVDGLHQKLNAFISKVRRILSWQDGCTSFILSISCLILSIALIWIQRPVFVIISCFIFLQA